MVSPEKTCISLTRVLTNLLIVFTQIWSQLTGMNVMMYYIVYVFGMAGLTGNTNLIASSIQYVINVGMTVFALIFIDRWGRRLPLLIGATLMGTWMFGNAGLMAVHGRPAPEGGIGGIAEQSWQIEGAPARAVIAFTYLFVASFAPTWGPVSICPAALQSALTAE